MTPEKGSRETVLAKLAAGEKSKRRRMGNYALTVAHCLQVPASRHVIKAARGRAYANFQLFTNFFPDLLPILTGLSSVQQQCSNDAISHARTHARSARSSFSRSSLLVLT